MKRDGAMLLPEVSLIFEGGAETFLHQGINDRWRDVLGAGELAQYDEVVARSFTPALARWAERGREGRDPRAIDDDGVVQSTSGAV